MSCMGADVSPCDCLVKEGCTDHSCLSIFVKQIVDKQCAFPFPCIINHRSIRYAKAVQCEAATFAASPGQDFILPRIAEIIGQRIIAEGL